MTKKVGDSRVKGQRTGLKKKNESPKNRRLLWSPDKQPLALLHRVLTKKKIEISGSWRTLMPK